MIRELAVLQLKTGAGAAITAAFASVAHYLTAADGYRRHRLVASIDHPDVYLLEVDWRDLSAHVEEFEPSAAHAYFMAALEPLLLIEPKVIHVPLAGFEDVGSER
jgi:heme-degrading monooxygenase HmoA